jgi:hypothetical protein
MKLRELFENMNANNISDYEMEELVNHVNRQWSPFGVKVSFGTHFAQRLNDPRNKPAIEVNEVLQLLHRIKSNALKAITKLPNPYHAVMKDPTSNLNLMFVIIGDKGSERNVVLKSIMRKADFTSKSKVFSETDK